MKKLFASFSSKMRSSSSASDSGSPATAGAAYKVNRRKMEKFHKAAWLGDVTKLRGHAMCDDNINKVDEHNRTALHLACANGHAEVVEFLLGIQADINLHDNHRRTPLMKAVQCQNDVCVNLLLDNKADPNLTDVDGNTALHLAANIPTLSCVIMLVKKDADLNVKNLKGLSPLTLTVRGDHVAVAEYLLRKGADVNILDKHQRSPLMIAAGNGHMDMVRMLLSFKADFTLKDNKRMSAKDYAIESGHRACALLISEHANKRNPAGSPAPPFVCDEIVKLQQVNLAEALETCGGPSTSKDGFHSPFSEFARPGHAIKEKFQSKERDKNKWLLSKCEEESLEKLELTEELGFGQFDGNEALDNSSISSPESLPGCKNDLQLEDIQECFSSSLEEDVFYVPPKAPFALPKPISPDDKKPVASSRSLIRRHSPNVILQESDESEWDDDSLISFCDRTQKDKRPLEEAVARGSPEVSTTCDGKPSFHSVEQRQKTETALPETCNESLSDREEEKSVSSHVQSFREMFNAPAKSGQPIEEKQSISTSIYGESNDEEDAKPLCSVRQACRSESGADDSVVESPGCSLKDNKIAERQSPARENIIVLGEAEESSQNEAPQLPAEKKVVYIAPPVCTAGQNTSAEAQAGPFHNKKIEEPAVAHETHLIVETPPNEPKTLVDQIEASYQVQTAVTSQRAESPRQQIFNPSPEGRTKDTSQFTVVSEACDLSVTQIKSGIGRDLLGFGSSLSDLSEDDGRTPSTIAITEDCELSKDADDGVISEDSDIILHIEKLDAVTKDSRSKKNLWDIDERCSLNANGHHDRQRLQELEIANHLLEQSNVESKSDVENLTFQLKMAINAIVSNKSTNKKEQLRAELEELQAHTSIKQRDLAEENEALKDQVEDLRQELRLAYDNDNQNALDWNDTMTSLKYELKLANERLETEQQAHNNLAAEFQLARTCLAEVERDRSDLKKALRQEKDEHQRLASEVACLRDNVNKLSQKLSKTKTQANALESDVRRYEVQMAEKDKQLSSAQRDSDQTALRIKELEAALQAEKELAARAALHQENAQEHLKQVQSEVASLRQRLDEAQSKVAAKENALTDAKKGFEDALFKLRSDGEEKVQQGRAAQKELASKANEVETLARRLEQEKTERQTCQRQLQQELDDSLKKLSKCEASLEFSTRYRTDLEEEKTRLLQDNDKLKAKLQESEAQCVQAEKEIKERASLLDERERDLSIAARKQKEAQAAVDASNHVTKELEEAVQRLELNNIRLEASAKQQCNKFDALQKVAQEDARMRAQLEDLVTSLQSRKLTLEDQLNKEVQKHNVLSNSAQDTQVMWEEELKSRSKLGLRLAELEKEKHDMNTQVEMAQKKAEELTEQKWSVDSRLDQEIKRNSELQKEIYRLQSLLKIAKKKLHDQQTSVGDRQKLNLQVDQLQAELEKEMSSRSQLERTKKQLEEEVLNLRRNQGPPSDGVGPAPPANIQYRFHCSKVPNLPSERPSCSVEDYLAKMRQDLDEAMSRELANPSVKLDMPSTCVSPVSRARQQYVNILKKNRQV
ncbi:ankyrin repeat domain-containing protein 26-like isoform X2 [Syngnathus scovelli]|uniref:ankyrin repeat domain-containing protein 26-like isoform X2 n=1 Tax=Syngnathus scovelli TaxID=161590 RepID=UPI00210F8266|nr:ankyrin repeat domain-containing protein 26-like isoform X2 [Syngnathus scovelli]